jgi:hypothetical protein
MTEDEVVVLKRGDTQTDSDGSEWWISGVSFKAGKPVYSRIKVGSPVYLVMVANGIIKGDEG